MSSKLVKKSLELFSGDLNSNEEPVKREKKKTENAMTQISTKKKGVKKELKRIQKQVQEKQKKNPTQRSAIDEYINSKPQDHTEASVASLYKLTKLSKLGDKATSTIVNHHFMKNRKEPMKKMKNKRKDKKKKLEPEQSVFTDQDFEKFFQEYNDPLNNS